MQKNELIGTVHIDNNVFVLRMLNSQRSTNSQPIRSENIKKLPS